MTQFERPEEEAARPGATLLDARIQSLTDRLVLSAGATAPPPPATTICAPAAHTPPSDADSVCADIDRWASSSLGDSSSQINESAKVRELEEEQARLSESVLTLSTHFAHIQFRIQQINAAPTEQRDSMLKELQEFASKGCVDLGQLKRDAEELKSSSTGQNTSEQDPTLSSQSREVSATATAKSHVVALIERLRAELEELERFAYDSGQHGAQLPLSEMKQRQKLVFDKLQEKIRLKIELEKLSGSEFQRTVEEGIEQVLNPMREKDQLVDQLQTQIMDLERFVAFLQRECAQLAPGDGFLAYDADEFLSAASFDVAATCGQKLSTMTSASGLPADFWRKESIANYVAQQKRSLATLIDRSASVESADSPPDGGSRASFSPLPVGGAVAAISGGGRDGSIHGMKPAVQRSQSVASGYALSGGLAANTRPSWIQRWLGCRSARRFEKNELKRTSLGNHYGDQRARMELAVHAVTQIMQKHQILSVDRSDRDPMPVERLDEPAMFECSDEAIVGVVRKEFCAALGDLLAHGMRTVVAPNCALHDDDGGPAGLALPSLPVPAFFGCGSQRKASSYASRVSIALKRFDNQKLEHIWDVIELYYECSRALEMRDAAVGRLSDAYKLETVDGRAATSKQVLLATVENVRSTHSRLQRSRDSMWKAFVSAALNHNRLPGWIRIVFRSTFILKKCYHSWAYVARTGCEDIRPLLERLHEYNFDLPVDLAVRPFEHIKEAF